VNLGREAATRAAERLIVLPPFAPTAETWARTTVESNIPTRCAVSLAASASKKASKVPDRLKRQNRFQTLFQCPNLLGRARQVMLVLKRQALAAGLKPPNHKRIYRVMKVNSLLLDRHADGIERRHDGRVAVDGRNRRWCSDGFEIGCDNGERVRVAFALDCCDREAMSFIATTGGISGDDVRDLIVAAVEHRFGRVIRLPVTIEWLSDNGSCYAGDTRLRSRHRS
jgi:transposase InsO family protein